MKDIIANSIEEVLIVLNKNADENTEFDFENPNDPLHSKIIEYDLTEKNDPIYWSYEGNKGIYKFSC